MWKHLIGYFAAALFGAVLGSAGLVVGANIPFFNPQQLQIPATGADLNNLVGQINNNALLAGPGGATGTAGSNSGTFSLYQGQPLGGTGTVVDGIQAVGASAGGVPSAYQGNGPQLRAIGADTNVNLGLNPQGSGLVQFVPTQSWIHQPTLALCPGYSAAAVDSNAGTLGPAQTITGYLFVMDDRGQRHAIPVC